MSVGRRIALLLAGVGLLVGLAPSGTGAESPRSPEVTPLATFSSLGSGSTIGPDGVLYVTDGNAGRVLRIDRRTGAVDLHAGGLPTTLEAVGIGGAMDVIFRGTRYVLVTLVGADVGGNDDAVGIYRVDGPHAVKPVRRHRRVQRSPTRRTPTSSSRPGCSMRLENVRRAASLSPMVTTIGCSACPTPGRSANSSRSATLSRPASRRDGNRVWMAQAGPIPHLPKDGKVIAVNSRSGEVDELASGARMLVDVEHGPGGRLYGLSQGMWDGVAEGTPARPNTGRLVLVGDDGTLTPVADGSGAELVLDRPTSLEFLGRSAYVVSLAGTVVRIDNL